MNNQQSDGRDHDGRAGLEAQLAALGERLQAIEQSFGATGDVLRVRGLEVVDEDGVVRVVLSTRYGTGSVLVRVDRPEGYTTGIELYAWQDPAGLEQPEAGLCTFREGDVGVVWPRG